MALKRRKKNTPSPGTARWRDPTVGRMIPTRIGQAVVLGFAFIAVWGGWQSLTRDTDTEAALRAAQQAVATHEATVGAVGLPQVQITEVVRIYMIKWLGGEDTNDLTVEEYPPSLTSRNVTNVRIVNIIQSTETSSFGVLYLVVVEATVDGNHETYAIPVIITGSGTSTNAFIAGPGTLLIAPPGVPKPQVWQAVLTDDSIDAEIVDAVSNFMRVYLTGSGRMELWTVSGSNLQPDGRFAGQNINIVKWGVWNITGDLVEVRVVIQPLGTTYEYAVRVSHQGGRWLVSEVLATPTGVV